MSLSLSRSVPTLSHSKESFIFSPQFNL
uniref:Uncharacterized protein n=1 Tax=Anguilla anguilla TaxID=7936 RepID=A0A0E9QSZ8_ANGAN